MANRHAAPALGGVIRRDSSRSLAAWRERALLLLATGVVCAGLALGASRTGRAAEPSDVDRWTPLKAQLFGERPLQDAQGVLTLDAPVRADDAAVVPIAIRTGIDQTPQRHVRTLYLIIDKNPSPLGAVFHFTPESGRAEIETRVRIEEYTNVRAIAEMNDGSLYMAARYVKASGGCSAPAGKDLEAAMARLGRMKLRVGEPVAVGEPSPAQLMISHPNVSGLAMDQVTRLYAPPHFVRKIKVSYAGREILTADVDFTISENPNFRFFFVPTGKGELKAEVVDTNDLTFTTSLAVDPATAAASSR